ncbi:oxidoreductase [Actinomadura sp. NBRC 104412]|uniref:PhzF family phenazine biosynthesis protein n=1 Tax=Actinomadura sp. NBRC 104412 TaxID=3032203 RepID=UPI0024A05319|nr:PhzF family phenazine biosynthesis protein [Actinomadura sp. NBRC 104412]GLZ03659.1 oxidoreductase [Actinomadura sp. NBRC 104412]
MRIFVIDAFTDRPFAGNPAGVCLLDAPADPAWMQRVAAEMRHSETAFVRPLDDDPGADLELRWFTPEVEVALCGHATLAAAHALYEAGAVPSAGPIRFRTLHSGVLTVGPGEGGLLEMDFPAVPPAQAPAPAGLADALGVQPGWTGRNAQDDLLVEVSGEDVVRKLTPDITALSAVDARTVIVTAQAAPDAGYDFVSRVFAPSVGIDEDPVTGSAHCALAPYWTSKLDRATLTGFQASSRGGHVRTELRGDRVLLSGKATTVLDGTLKATA